VRSTQLGGRYVLGSNQVHRVGNVDKVDVAHLTPLQFYERCVGCLFVLRLTSALKLLSLVLCLYI
jgi:hypothetical protein